MCFIGHCWNVAVCQFFLVLSNDLFIDAKLLGLCATPDTIWNACIFCIFAVLFLLQPPPVPIHLFQASSTICGFNSCCSATLSRNPALSRVADNNASGKSKQQDNELKIDPWTLLEDNAGSFPSPSNASSKEMVTMITFELRDGLKGAVRVRRTDITHVDAVDDDISLTIFFYAVLAINMLINYGLFCLFLFRMNQSHVI